MLGLGPRVGTGSDCGLKATQLLLGGCDVLMLGVVRKAVNQLETTGLCGPEGEPHTLSEWAVWYVTHPA